MKTTEGKNPGGWATGWNKISAPTRRIDSEADYDNYHQYGAPEESDRIRCQLLTHYLFNALTGLRSLIPDNAKPALHYLDDLSRHLRLLVDSVDDKEHSALNELSLAAAFLNFHRHRCDIRPEVTLPAPDDGLADVLIPPGALCTLLENALKHGTPEGDGAIRIKVSMTHDASGFRMQVDNAGDDFPTTASKPTGGLARLHKQLLMLHGDSAGLEITRSGGVISAILTVKSPDVTQSGPPITT